MNKKQYIICGMIILILSGLATHQIMREVHCKFYGVNKEALCLKIPKYCSSRNNRIEIQINDKIYNPLIGRNACITQKYKIQKKYNLLYSEKYDHVIIPERKPQITILFLVLGYGLSLFCFMKFYTSK